MVYVAPLSISLVSIPLGHVKSQISLYTSSSTIILYTSSRTSSNVLSPPTHTPLPPHTPQSVYLLQRGGTWSSYQYMPSFKLMWVYIKPLSICPLGMRKRVPPPPPPISLYPLSRGSAWRSTLSRIPFLQFSYDYPW